MPETAEFPRKRGRGRPPKFDWDKYFDGERHIFHPGRDFTCKPESFRALVHSTARNRTEDGPWKAHTQIDPPTGRVMFYFFREES